MAAGVTSDNLSNTPHQLCTNFPGWSRAKGELGSASVHVACECRPWAIQTHHL